MKKLIYLFTILALVSCKKPPKEPISNTSTASIIGIWKTTSMHGKFYKNNVLTIDSTIFAPYYGEIDIIETIRFADSLVYMKINNDTSEGAGEKYNKSGNYIIVTDSISSDTLLFINSLTSTNFDFTLDYTQTYLDTDDTYFSGRSVMYYKSVKQ